MSSHLLERIVISNFSCDHVEHQGRIIYALCLNPKCQATCPLCSRCSLKGHSQCRDHVCELEVIPDKLMELR